MSNDVLSVWDVMLPFQRVCRHTEVGGGLFRLLNFSLSQQRLSSGLSHVAREMPDISEEHIASIFIVEDKVKQETSEKQAGRKIVKCFVPSVSPYALSYSMQMSHVRDATLHTCNCRRNLCLYSLVFQSSMLTLGH
jgi:hypothetical protein